MTGMQHKIYMGAPCLDDLEAKSVYAQVASGWISQGRRTEEFESLVCDKLQVKHAVAMCNGTATLHAMLLSLGVSNGDYVVVPSLTYISSVNVIYLCGAIPVYVDVDPKTLTLCLDDTIAALKMYNAKVVMSVDLKGLPCDYSQINAICEEFGAIHVADSAESLGAEYINNPVGGQALMHSFSLFANKTITCGEGGFVTTNDSNIYKKLVSIRNQGQGSKRYEHIMFGCNYRFTDVKASIAIPQLNKLDNILSRRKEVVSDIKEKLFGVVEFQHVPNYVSLHPYYNLTILFSSADLRQDAISIFDEEQIEWRISFPPCHMQPYQSRLEYRSVSKLMNTVHANDTMLDIPCHQNLSDLDISRIVGSVKNVVS